MASATSFVLWWDLSLDYIVNASSNPRATKFEIERISWMKLYNSAILLRTSFRWPVVFVLPLSYHVYFFVHHTIFAALPEHFLFDDMIFIASPFHCRRVLQNLNMIMKHHIQNTFSKAYSISSSDLHDFSSPISMSYWWNENIRSQFGNGKGRPFW